MQEGLTKWFTWRGAEDSYKKVETDKLKGEAGDKE